MRQGRLDAGRDLLRRTRHELLLGGRRAAGRAMPGDGTGGAPAGPGPPVSVDDILWRWFHPAWAYWVYRRGELDRALAGLDRADAAICRAIDRDPFLLPLANHCADFLAQRIRVARNRRDPAELARRIEHARLVYADRLPLCRPRLGPVYFLTIAEHCRATGAFSAAELHDLRDAAGRCQGFEHFLGRLRMAAGG